MKTINMIVFEEKLKTIVFQFFLRMQTVEERLLKEHEINTQNTYESNS